MRSKIAIGLFVLVAAGALSLAFHYLWAPLEAQAQGEMPFSYPVKFVCGFTRTNSGPPTPGITPSAKVGENVVKLGNYATDINIYNPAEFDFEVANIKKKLAVLVKDPDIFVREPQTTPAEVKEQIQLTGMAATMDDCNKLYQLAGMPNPLTPPPLMIGFLVILSDRPLDVTAVYTSEICSDYVLNPPGGGFMCTNGNGVWGAGISIDVEQVRGRDLRVNTP